MPTSSSTLTTNRRGWNRAISIFVVPSLAGGVAALLWWRGWLYHGWPGSPGLFPALLQTDGEASYDAILTEMFLISIPAAIGLSVLTSLLKKPSSRGGLQVRAPLDAPQIFP